MSTLILSVCALILFAAFVLVVFYLMIRWKRALLYTCIGFVTVGFMLYTASYLSSGMSLGNTFSAALRGMFSAARMLSINDDHSVLLEIHGTQWLTENVFLQIIFWLCHVAAVIIVNIALFSLFGRKLTDKYRLYFGLHNELYVIKGSDKNAFLLAENIVMHDGTFKRPDTKRLIVFLLQEDDDEKKIYENAARFNGIVKVINRNNNLESCLNTFGLNGKNMKKFYVVLMSDDASLSDDTRRVLEHAKRNNIAPDNLNVYVLTSSEWNRKKTETVIEDTEQKYPYTIHIMSEVDLVTREMIRTHPPYKCDLQFKDGKAARNFTVMILGFGTIGQQALLRLIMNGQFIGSRMRAIIVDNNINNLSKYFMHRYPGLNLCCDIDFSNNFDVQSKDFFSLLDKEAPDLNYIVIALSDDELNKQTALDIQMHYDRKNINELPFVAVSEKNGVVRAVKQDEKIFVFGCREDIYKESMIIREELDVMAKAVNDTYNGENPSEVTLWHDLDWETQESNRATADFIPAMLKLAEITKDELVNKTLLTDDVDLAETLAKTEHLRWNAFHVARGWRSISIDGMNQHFAANSDKKLCRNNSKARFHVCLTSWDELDRVNEAYSLIIQDVVDFKKYDRGITGRIPKYLELIKGYNHEQ